MRQSGLGSFDGAINIVGIGSMNGSNWLVSPAT
jgi:hypothetical protein